MSPAINAEHNERERELRGQTVVVIGGSSGIGLETARRARAEGADVFITGRDRERLEQAARAIGIEHIAAFDANDATSLQSFFENLPGTIDHVMVTAGAPHYRPPLEMLPEEARRDLTQHLLLAINVARSASVKIRPLGSVTFMGRHGRAPPEAWLRNRLDCHRRDADPHRKPCARARADPRQSDCSRLRRHAIVGLPAGRGPRREAQRIALDASYPAARGTSRCRRVGRSYHDELRIDGCHL